MSHIFISYSKQNREYARKLTEKLRQEGFEVWIDDRIDYGETWERVIFDAIDDCNAFLVIMSPESYASDWVLRECQYADKRKKPQFPILLDGEEFPRYGSVQYVDAQGGKLPPEEFYVRLEKVASRRGGQGTNVTESPKKFDMTGWLPEMPSPDTEPSPDPDEAETRKAVERFRRNMEAILKLDSQLSLPDVSSILPVPFEWCEIPAGQVTIEYSETDHITYDVPAFAMAKYPVTNAQYQVFLDAYDGYRDPAWWEYSDAAREWRQQNAHSKKTSFFGDELPHRVVSWYEAVAFCQWLTARIYPLSTSPEIAGGVLVALPTEQQWQRAAQGDDGRKYPWGNGFDKTRCNTEESGIGKVTPVMQYPNGVSPFGVMDMSGNVWEWCLTQWDSDGINDLAGENTRVLRGGSFYDFQDLSRGAYRNCALPVNRYFDIGFRVVCHGNGVQSSGLG